MARYMDSGACAACKKEVKFATVVLDQRLEEYVGLCESCAPTAVADVVRAMFDRYKSRLS